MNEEWEKEFEDYKDKYDFDDFFNKVACFYNSDKKESAFLMLQELLGYLYNSNNAYLYLYRIDSAKVNIELLPLNSINFLLNASFNKDKITDLKKRRKVIKSLKDDIKNEFKYYEKLKKLFEQNKNQSELPFYKILLSIRTLLTEMQKREHFYSYYIGTIDDLNMSVVLNCYNPNVFIQSINNVLSKRNKELENVTDNDFTRTMPVARRVK